MPLFVIQFVVDLVKNKFGLNPLLVTYNTHFNTKVGIRNLARLISKLDCDHLISTVGPDTIKEITKIVNIEIVRSGPIAISSLNREDEEK